MASGRKGKAGQRKGKGGGGRSASRQRPAKLPLAAHRAFAPLLGAWGALLGAGVVVVLPEPMVAQMLRGTLIGTWAAAAQPALAWIAGGLLGVLLFAFAAWRHVRARRGKRGPSIAAMAARRVTPINPARDLGSLRLDDPVETMPFSTPAWRDADAGDAQRAAVPEPASAPAAKAAAEAAPAAAAAPRELDLAEFAELPGRNAVWVEEAAPAVAEPAPAPALSAAAPAAHPHRSTSAPLPVPGSAALARLRAVPANQLSLAEMVERFAGALHEVRETSPGRSLGPGDLAAREAALAEALRALEALSGTNRPAPRLPRRDEPLPAARARLQPHLERVRGAA